MNLKETQSNPEPSTKVIVVESDGSVKLSEEGLRKWFQSRSKDGKRGWVDVVDGDACAREKGETATPKCVSSEKRASMSKKERLAAQRAKRREDPNQPSKSGAAKPTYVKTDRKKMKEELTQEGLGLSLARTIDKTKPPVGRPSVRRRVSTALKMREVTKSSEKNAKRKFSGKAAGVKEELIPEGKKDACYHKVKASAKVWPSAYASGRLVQCRKKGAANYGKSTKKEHVQLKSFRSFLDESAWTRKEGQNKSGGLNEKGRKSYERANPGSDLKAPSKKVGNPRRASFCARMKGMKKKLTSKKTASDPDSRINKSLRAWNC